MRVYDDGTTECAPTECHAGGCTREKRQRFEARVNGRVMEIREFCDPCATLPEYGYLRRGMTHIGPVTR